MLWKCEVMPGLVKLRTVGLRKVSPKSHHKLFIIINSISYMHLCDVNGNLTALNNWPAKIVIISFIGLLLF